MSQESKEIVARWFAEYWGKKNPAVVDELGADDLLFFYPLAGELRGREQVKKRIIGFKERFPEGGFELTDELIAEGDRVVALWKGGGTHTGPAWELPMGSLPEASGKTMHYTGTTVYRVRDGKIVEERGQGDYLKALQQLGLVP